MNVLTGLIVDNAMKATIEDEDEVIKQIFLEDKKPIAGIAKLFKHDKQFLKDHSISWPPIQRDLETNKKGTARKFLDALEISAADAYRVFNMFDSGAGNRVLLDSF